MVANATSATMMKGKYRFMNYQQRAKSFGATNQSSSARVNLIP
jgi:hypothetical protein